MGGYLGTGGYLCGCGIRKEGLRASLGEGGRQTLDAHMGDAPPRGGHIARHLGRFVICNFFNNELRLAEDEKMRGSPRGDQ